MNFKEIAVILVGYQNDYFAENGILRGVVEEPGRVDEVLKNSISLIKKLIPTEATILATGIVLTPSYRALANSTGILDKIKEVGAFTQGTPGAEIIDEIKQFGNKITFVTGKEGFNSFQDTDLDKLLKSKGIKQVWVAGMVTSLCIDSTARAAYEKGYQVSILEDCCSARTPFEQEFFCQNVFPLYANVISSSELDASPELT
jgi:nicotinamidase-related amidase